MTYALAKDDQMWGVGPRPPVSACGAWCSAGNRCFLAPHAATLPAAEDLSAAMEEVTLEEVKAEANGAKTGGANVNGAVASNKRNKKKGKK
eukprot:314999-Pyramimonas_sp.AAC.1